MIMVKRNRRERDKLAEGAVGMAKVPGPEKLDVKDIKKTLIKREEKNKTLMKMLQKEWPQYQELKNCMSKLFI